MVDVAHRGRRSARAAGEAEPERSNGAALGRRKRRSKMGDADILNGSPLMAQRIHCLLVTLCQI